MKQCLINMFIVVSCFLTQSCQTNLFEIYYLPINMELYVPPTRDDLIANGKYFTINSNKIGYVFNYVAKQVGVEAFPEDYTGLRIMMIDKSNNTELFITSDKVIISLDKKKRYSVDITIVEEVLSELRNYVDNN